MNDITVETGIRHFLKYCRSKNLSPNTIQWYEMRLNYMAGFLSGRASNVSQIKTSDLRDMVSQALSELAVTSVNNTLGAAKTFFRFLCDESYLDSNPAQRIEKVRAPHTLIHTFSQKQMDELLAAPGMRRFAGMRDSTIMLLLLDTALRISEAVNIRLEDIDWNHCTIRVMGKGARERLVPFGRTVRNQLKDYLDRRGEADSDYLFVNEFGNQISTRQVQDAITQYGRKCGIAGVRCSPHTFRHTAAVNWIRNGGDVFSLQRILGHSSLEMVRRYVALSTEDIEAAHRRYSPVDRMLGKSEDKRERRKRLR